MSKRLATIMEAWNRRNLKEKQYPLYL
nr:hypothetical protein [Sulfoacidibacillus ferrooxidans]